MPLTLGTLSLGLCGTASPPLSIPGAEVQTRDQVRGSRERGGMAIGKRKRKGLSSGF